MEPVRVIPVQIVPVQEHPIPESAEIAEVIVQSVAEDAIVSPLDNPTAYVFWANIFWGAVESFLVEELYVPALVDHITHIVVLLLVSRYAKISIGLLNEAINVEKTIGPKTNRSH